MASSLPPELMQFLLEQQAAEGRTVKPHRFPASPGISNVPETSPRGVFTTAQGTRPANVTLNALKGVGNVAKRVAGPAGVAATGWQAGSGLYDMAKDIRQDYDRTALAERYKESGYGGQIDRNAHRGQLPPELGGPLPAPVGIYPETMETSRIPATTERAQQMPKTYLPEELIDLQPIAEESAHGSDMQGEVPPEMLVEAQDEIPPEMLVEAQLLQQQAPPRVEEFPESRGTLSALGKNTSQAPAPYVEKPKSFGRKTLDFFRSGSRNPDLDKHNAALDNYERQNKLTDRDKMAGDTASKDVFSARAANYGGEMAKYAGEGVSPADKFMADAYESDQKDTAQSSRDLTQHSYRMDEIEAGKKGGKSLDDIINEFEMNLAEKYPDSFPKVLEKYGIDADPEGMTSIRKGREGSDASLAKMALIMDFVERRRGGSGPDKTPASEKVKAEQKSKKTVEIKDKSMLQQAK
jgi:hypothetical protein